jgi:hypothetical protein
MLTRIKDDPLLGTDIIGLKIWSIEDFEWLNNLFLIDFFKHIAFNLILYILLEIVDPPNSLIKKYPTNLGLYAIRNVFKGT